MTTNETQAAEKAQRKSEAEAAYLEQFRVVQLAEETLRVERQKLAELKDQLVHIF